MDVRSLIERVEATHVSVADRSTVQARLADLGKLSAWVEAHRAQLTNRLRDIKDCHSPEDDIASAQRSSAKEARTATRRAKTVEQLPVLGTALSEGDIAPAHVDEIANGLAK